MLFGKTVCTLVVVGGGGGGSGGDIEWSMRVSSSAQLEVMKFSFLKHIAVWDWHGTRYGVMKHPLNSWIAEYRDQTVCHWFWVFRIQTILFSSLMEPETYYSTQYCTRLNNATYWQHGIKGNIFSAAFPTRNNYYDIMRGNCCGICTCNVA